MRKESGFEVADNINLYVSGNEKLEAVVKKFDERIKKETLSMDVIYNANREYNNCNINGEKLDIAVEVVNK